MDGIGFVFPGQGSQRAGMGLDLVRAHPELASAYYGPADDILGFPLSRLCWEGPELALRDTAVTQPAVFLVSLGALHVDLSDEALFEAGTPSALADIVSKELAAANPA